MNVNVCEFYGDKGVGTVISKRFLLMTQSRVLLILQFKITFIIEENAKIYLYVTHTKKKDVIFLSILGHGLVHWNSWDKNSWFNVRKEVVMRRRKSNGRNEK